MNCNNCHTKQGKPSIKCACLTVRYCSKKCQKEDVLHLGSCVFAGAAKKGAAASGTGYGGNDGQDQKQRKAGVKQAMKRETQVSKEWQKELKTFLTKNHTAAVAKGEDASAILNTLKQVLRCQAPDWWWKQPQRNLYITALQVCDVLTQHYPKSWGDSIDNESPMAALEELAQTAKMLVKQLGKNNTAKPASDGALAQVTTWFLEQLSSSKNTTHDKDAALPMRVVEIRDQAAAAVKAVLERPECSMMDSQDYYRQVMRPLAFSTVEAFESPKHYYSPGGGYKARPALPDYHAYAAKGKKKKTGNQKDDNNGVKTSAAVLWKEISTYPTALPIEYGSSIFVRAVEDQMDMLRVMIIGPEDTPYANGCFFFDVHMGNDYPNAPPKVQFLTTYSFLSGAAQRVRFNPNLYEDGKVCLSLLGTWSGPGWQPGESTLLQVLVSMQSLILGVADPYFNEPGYQSTEGTPHGKKASDDYNKNIRRQTLRVAIIPFLRNQLNTKSDGMATSATTATKGKRKEPPGVDATYDSKCYFNEFADVVTQHFRLKQRAVQKQLYQWLQEDPTLEKLYSEYWNIWEMLEEESQALTNALARSKNAARLAKKAKKDAPAVKICDGVILLDSDDEDDEDASFEAATARAIQMSVEKGATGQKSAAGKKKDEVVELEDSDDESDCKPAAVSRPSKAVNEENQDEKKQDSDDNDDVVDLTA